MSDRKRRQRSSSSEDHRRKKKHHDDRSQSASKSPEGQNGKTKDPAELGRLDQFIKNSKMIEVLQKKGIKYFFPIQYETFKTITEGKDLIARDRTGSGKTIAFSLPVIERFRRDDEFSNSKTKMLIVLPTRQLAIQVRQEIRSIRLKDSEFSVVNVYGGADMHEQIREIREGADIIVATPGRLLDLLEREIIKLNNLKVTVLDEADEMLKQGFQQDIEKIFEYIQKHTSKKTQNLLFSATIPSWVLDIAKTYLDENLIKNSEVKTSKTVEHLGINCPYYSRNAVISDVVNLYGGLHGRTIIFCETKKEANEIFSKANLKQEAHVLHGDIPQKQREVSFKSFKEGKLKCLIATNVAARGLDIPEVDLIVQLEPPKDVQTYIHRAGRTGRAGRSGICVTFFTKTQLPLIERIERIAKMKFKRTGVPQPVDIIKASARDIVISLKSVRDAVLPFFLDIAKEMIDQVGDPVKALAKALAYISGNTDKISQRSLLNSAQGFITYIIRSPVEFNSVGFIFNFLRNFLPQKVVSQVKGMRKFGKNVAAFDVPDGMREQMDRCMDEIKHQEGRSKGFSLEGATSLADLEEIDQQNHPRQQAFQDQQIDEKVKRQAYRRKRDLEIFVGGLPYNADENEVSQFFRQRKVSTVATRLLRSDTGESRGIAFVLCADDRSVKKAIQMNGQRFGTRTLKINLAGSR